jgi:hypothetical protein
MGRDKKFLRDVKILINPEFGKAGYLSHGKIKHYAAHFKEKWFLIICEEMGNPRCSQCGYDRCFDAIDFHHVPGSEKLFNISQWMMKSPVDDESVRLFREELHKTIMLCANCHREHHAEIRKKNLEKRRKTLSNPDYYKYLWKSNDFPAHK